MNNWIYSEKKIFKTKHKYYNLQVGLYTEKEEQTYVFDSSVGLSRRCDHAGFRFEVSIWNFYFIFYTYDHRHWDYEKGTWYEYND